MNYYDKLFNNIIKPLLLGLIVLAVIAVLFGAAVSVLLFTPDWIFWTVFVGVIAWGIGKLFVVDLV